MGNAIALVDPPKLRRSRKAFSVSSLRGKTVWPVAVAEFKRGEKIRMTISMMAGRPWDFARARRLLAQTIGNERGCGGAAYAAATIDLDRKISAAAAIAKDPGTNYEEAGAARLGMERLQQSRRKAIERAQTDVLHAFSAKHGQAYPPATDFASFHLELDGERIEPTLALPKETRARIPKPKTSSEKGNAMSSQDYNVSVRSRVDGGEPLESVELVHASTSTIALKVARRAFFTKNPSAAIESAEIVWPDEISPLTEDEIESAPAAPVATNVVPINVRSAASASAPDKPCTGAESISTEDLLNEFESRMGSDFLNETRAWKRVRSRIMRIIAIEYKKQIAQ